MEGDQEGSTHISPFDAIRQMNEHGQEYWSARDLAKLLGYGTNYRNFKPALEKAKEACKQSGQAISDHIAETRTMIRAGKGAQREVEDIHLSRYGAYLTVQNADASKPIVALGQTYFAVQTRRQELGDQLAALPEDQKRLLNRSEMAIFNRQLNQAARASGVITANDFQTFTNHGYRGLYGGLAENDIHGRKNLDPNQHILDHMGSEELGANIFRATQTEAKLRRENITGKTLANEAHYEVGLKVRQTIEELGGTMPENLPTPEKSIQQIQQEEQKRLKQGPQLPLFDDSAE